MFSALSDAHQRLTQGQPPEETVEKLWPSERLFWTSRHRYQLKHIAPPLRDNRASFSALIITLRKTRHNIMPFKAFFQVMNQAI